MTRSEAEDVVLDLLQACRDFDITPWRSYREDLDEQIERVIRLLSGEA